MMTTHDFKLKMDFKFTTGWRTVDGHPGETSGWPGCMEKRHDILRKTSPSHEEADGYPIDRKLTCAAASHYGLWLG